MGRAARDKPEKLAEKLRLIREGLGLSQDGLLIRMGYQDTNINRSSISGYERGDREPPLLVLLAYARLANVYLDVLADDNLQLPTEIPSPQKNKGT